MKLIVCKILFCFLCFYEQLSLSKTVISRLEFSYPLKNIVKQTLNSVSTKFQPQRKDRKKHLPSKTNFATFLLLNCSTFRLKQCERPCSYQKCPKKYA